MRYYQILLVFCLLSFTLTSQAKSVTDILGRQVIVPDYPQRIQLSRAKADSYAAFASWATRKLLYHSL
ncbi:TPA: Fe3+-hydroxamate ABC transporter substrate-binding protein [Yersinia enterocolitica]|uniref:Periplasmic binding protein n=1 Tax=Yersinia enterocolitica subsp. palearctica serotype O:3 (strain DSM 13030 / CIP 106945 / Y11) TaxID=930944 RepID=A0A0H3NLN4_YERE1|nr:hypothetical protein [Yersinia enterocolitica]ADZ41571.1 ABC-type Fe3+-hydroxamate transport system, periplasmic component [Yersinia enterocolitica subsp. palearctica 105.5R(r)]EOR67831.1 periplasmic binding protein [Yersinia enterocolitica subsp. palearctica YE-149]EOR76635.1 periplasmic binding protein [Yersinia enterocolitica subsp. palearctica YE-150]EOR76852.1 periplasmic binding protein [Yersinia enterocolitica subsp. palearctica YE-P1]EOR81949.1 periplasmic binding protein [Yersinia 